MKRNRDFIILMISEIISFAIHLTFIESGVCSKWDYSLRELCVIFLITTTTLSIVISQIIMSIRNYAHKRIRKSEREDFLFVDFERLMKGE